MSSPILTYHLVELVDQEINWWKQENEQTDRYITQKETKTLYEKLNKSAKKRVAIRKILQMEEDETINPYTEVRRLGEDLMRTTIQEILNEILIS